ncbi:hypothetical protein DRB17_05560 [Ferruginivarius sediminum]|uniref:J domain-containing protein n=2 Tax=Ferruginivarius sediminum TaxID=2661937 RepID=A0A369TBH2_9PROT|nr:hypothetical protein DRB17_05560 [Ferruginivarius sediminum]
MVGGSLQGYAARGGVFTTVGEVAEELRTEVARFDRSATETASDDHLAPDGVQAKVGEQAETLGKRLDGHSSVTRAKEAISRRREEIEREIGDTIGAQPADENERQIAAEIRAQIGKASRPYDEARKYLGDAKVMNAILVAPAMLTGLTEDQQARLKRELLLRHHPDKTDELDALDSATKLLEGAVSSAKKLAHDRTQQARAHALQRLSAQTRNVRATGQPMSRHQRR